MLATKTCVLFLTCTCFSFSCTQKGSRIKLHNVCKVIKKVSTKLNNIWQTYLFHADFNAFFKPSSCKVVVKFFLFTAIISIEQRRWAVVRKLFVFYFNLSKFLLLKRMFVKPNSCRQSLFPPECCQK